MKAKASILKESLLSIFLIVFMLTILLYKSLISTYLSAYITLIPSIIILIIFLFMFFQGKINLKLYDFCFAIMLCVGFISGLINHQRFIAILYQIKSLSIYYLFFMIIRNINFKTKQINLLLKSINILTIILVIFSFIEIIFHKNILFPSAWADGIVYADNYIRAYSLICNPNVYAFYLIFVLIYNYRFGNVTPSLKNILYYSLILTGIILSISRSGLIAIIMIILFWLVFLIIKMRNKLKDALKLIFLVISISLLFTFSIYKLNNIYIKFYVSQNNTSQENKPDSNETQTPTNNDKTNITENFFDRITATTSKDFVANSSSNGRIAIIIYGINVWKKSPIIGTGFSSFLSASNFLNPNIEAQQQGLSYADNQYIVLLVESGIIGILAGALAFLLILKEQIVKNKLTSFIATLVFLFFGLFINVLEVQLISFIYFMFIGLDNSSTSKITRKVF